MENILQYLFVAVIIIAGIVRTINKAKQEAPKEITEPFPVPRAFTIEPPVETKPVRRPNAKQTPKPTVSVTPPPAVSRVAADDPFALHSSAEENSDFQIETLEDARKAMVWSEIMQRKY
jgi:hypothetical protein